MSLRGWEINLSGSAITVYGGSKNWTQQGSQIGTLTANECYVEGTGGTGWDGWGLPVVFKNTAGSMVLGAVASLNNTANFADYASNGSSWVSVNTLQRKVQYATKAYYADGSLCCDLAAGSSVWLTQNCTAGATNRNYVAVTKVETSAGKEYNFSGNGFVDLTYGGRWLNVGSILLRKA